MRSTPLGLAWSLATLATTRDAAMPTEQFRRVSRFIVSCSKSADFIAGPCSRSVPVMSR